MFRRAQPGPERGPGDESCVNPADPAHAWNRLFTMWQVGFWLFLAGGVARLLTAADLSTGRRVTGLVTLVVIGLAYAILRPSPVADRVVPDVGYPLVVVVGAGLLCAVDPTLSILLTIFYSQMWLFAQRDRTAVLFVVGLSVSCTIGLTLNEPFSVEALVVNALIMLVSLAFSVIVGLWLTGIIDQSRERADLIRELESTRDQLGEAHHAQGVMAERERMAREIHDTLAQGYTSIIMLAQAARLPGTPPHDTDGRLQTIEAVARENLDEARALVATFSPVGLDGAGLAEALHRLAGRFTAETGVVVDVVVDGELSGLPPHREVVLLRAAQEAMANVRRHADARAVRMTLSASAGQARVEVTDDGVGFAPSTAPGFGLTGMRDRVRDAGGSVDVASTPGQGTRVSVRVPVDVVGAGAGAGAGAEGPA